MVTYKYRKGHKIIIWNNKKLIDHLNGVKIVLDIAYKNNFFELYYSMVKNIYSIIDFCIYKDVFMCICSILYNINFDILNKYNKYKNVKLYRYKFIYKMIKVFFIVLKKEINLQRMLI